MAVLGIAGFLSGAKRKTSFECSVRQGARGLLPLWIDENKKRGMLDSRINI